MRGRRFRCDLIRLTEPLFDSPHSRSENLETHRDDPRSFTPITHGKNLATKLLRTAPFREAISP